MTFCPVLALDFGVLAELVDSDEEISAKVDEALRVLLQSGGEETGAQVVSCDDPDNPGRKGGATWSAIAMGRGRRGSRGEARQKMKPVPLPPPQPPPETLPDDTDSPPDKSDEAWANPVAGSGWS